MIVGGILLVVVFVGALIGGRRVGAPIELARQRQMEFTADASHELRTPLSVIEAQTSLALVQERDAAWYRTAFQRIGNESQRIRRLVDDLLWLARADSTESREQAEPVEIGVLATRAVERFAAVAEARQLTITAGVSAEPHVVSGSAEWLDRLQRVQVRTRKRERQRLRRERRWPGASRCRRLRSGDSRRGAAPDLRPLPSRIESSGRFRPRAGDCRRGGPPDSRPLGDRHIRVARRRLGCRQLAASHRRRARTGPSDPGRSSPGSSTSRACRSARIAAGQAARRLDHGGRNRHLAWHNRLVGDMIFRNGPSLRRSRAWPGE